MAKQFEIAQKRVFGFVGHAGAGKTSICEAILFNTKANERLGSVLDGLAIMDFEPEEQKRQYSVSASFFDVEHKECHLFMADTPGNSNFIPEASTLLPALGAVVFPVDALDGVKHQTELLTEQAKQEKIPFIAFINRIDKEHSNFDKALTSIENAFAIEPVLVQLPIGAEDGFKGIVDLMANKAYTYSDSGKGKVCEIPEDMKDLAEEARTSMIERLVEADDDVMEKYLEGEEPTDTEMANCLKKGIINGAFCPVLCGSALKNIGIDLLLDIIAGSFPDPTEERSRKVSNPDTGEESELSIGADGPFLAQVIKTMSDPFTGKVSIFRVFRGELRTEDQFFNVDKNSKEKPGKLFLQRGKNQEPLDVARTGDIVAVIKLKDISTGHTMTGLDGKNVKFPPLPIMEPMVHRAILPKSQGEEEKMSSGIARILEEDANLRFWREDQTTEFILSGVGEAQLAVAMERMKRKFGVEVVLSEPRIPYRETLKGKAEVQGKHKKQSGGRGQYGDCHIRVESLPRGSGFEFVDSIVGGVIPKNFIPAVEKGIIESMLKGDLTGNPVQDVKVELFYGSYHAVDSSEMAFKTAGSIAWKKAFAASNPVLLEPIFKVAITVPSENMGDVYGNISSRRGKVLGSEDAPRTTTIFAELPQAEMYSLAPDLRAMTGDRAVFVANFDHHEEVPRENAEKIIEAFQKAKEEG